MAWKMASPSSIMLGVSPSLSTLGHLCWVHHLACLTLPIMLVHHLAYPPIAQKLGASTSNCGGQKSHCWRSPLLPPPSNPHPPNPSILIFWADSKLSPLPHYLECTWWLRFFTHHPTFHYPNSLLGTKLLFVLFIYSLKIYLIYGNQRQHCENDQRG